VERGLGLCFLPQLAVGREVQSGKLATVKVMDGEHLGRSLDVVHPRHRALRSEALAFLKVIREAAKLRPALNPKSNRLRKGSR
jgi:DNA-binding transcriptional LysR family regulator